jgi:syntaxin-binding protein 5
MDCATVNLSVRNGEHLENVRIPHKPHNRAPSPAHNMAPSQDEAPDNQQSPAPTGDRQLVVVCTDKMASVYALPSQRQMYSQTISESTNGVLKANIVNFKEGKEFTACLVCYAADGFLRAYSLPSLRPMMETYFIAPNPRVLVTMNFAHYGHGLFFCNATEVQKFSLTNAFMSKFPELQGSVFQVSQESRFECTILKLNISFLLQDGIPMPEPPSKGFLKGLFGSGPKTLDREELFGETAGKIGTGVAKHIPGKNMAAMQQLQAKSAGSTSEVGKAHANFVERGQKISELEDRTEAMANEAKTYATNSHKLMLEAKNKKWYQL